MFRVHGHVLAENKSIWIALTAVYGVGRVRSKQILDELKINYLKKVKDISEDEQKLIADALKGYVLENDLRREI
jgi:small subunit ribosomal protein S13